MYNVPFCDTQYPSKGMVLGFDILRVWKDKALTKPAMIRT